MATQEQIETLLAELKKAPPSEHFRKIDEDTAGIRAILKYLNTACEQATAGQISKYLNVSSARVAVLLKKMVAKNLVEKEKDLSDGRVVVVRLSEHGRQIAEKIHNDLHAHIGTMIDNVGMERMMDFARISNEIHSVMKHSEDELF